MAIVFETMTSEVNLKMAYNNDVLRFYSNDSLNPAEFADITLTKPGATEPSATLRLYPSPDGKFYVNLQPYAAALINTKGFADTVDPNIGGADVNNYLYDFTVGTVLKIAVTIIVPNQTYTTFFMYITGVEQLSEYNTFDKRDFYVLSPLKKLTNNQYFVKYWEGYPFDLPLFFGDNVLGNINDYTILNKTNMLDMSFQIDKAGSLNIVNRLVFSDGRTDETLEDILPLVEGINQLVWFKEEATEEKARQITLEKVPYKCGAYIKWLNKYGGYSYWLFENTFSIDRSTKAIGEMNRDNDNFADSTGRVVQMGQVSQDTVRVIAELLNDDERRIAEGVLESPKVYLFTGQPFARNSYNNWMEISLKTNNARVKNAKQPLTNFVFDFETPNRYTQTL